MLIPSMKSFRGKARQAFLHLPAENKLLLLREYMDVFIDNLPNKTIPFHSWVIKKFTIDLRDIHLRELERYRNTCYYCGVDLTQKNKTKDHIIPVSRGGKKLNNNTVPCCNSCNTWKSSYDIEQWKRVLSATLSKKIGARVYKLEEIKSIINKLKAV